MDRLRRAAAALAALALLAMAGCASAPQPTMQLTPHEVQTDRADAEEAAKPAASPTATPGATASPTAKPTARPTAKPTAKPTPKPTLKPAVLTEEKKEEIEKIPVRQEDAQEDETIQQSRPTAPPVQDTVPKPAKPATPKPTPVITPAPSPTPQGSSNPSAKPTPTAKPTPSPTEAPFPNQTGWYTKQGNQYYLVEGTPITGWQIIEGRRYCFNESGIRTSRTGIDVSSYQKSIDWKKAAADDVSFAFIRIGGQYYRQEGGFYLDTYFEQNYSGAASNGIDTGVYFFSQAITPEEAQQEALWVINQLDGRHLDLPIVYDLEDPASDSRFHLANLNRQEVTDLCRTFCETIEANGYQAAVYTNPSWINSMLYLDQLSDFPLWLAHYTSDLLPSGSDRWTWWQYTSTGTVDGISGNVDINVLR